MSKKIYRSRDNQIIAGVCGGLGNYLNIDPVIVRIIMLGLFFAGGFGFITYIIAWIIIPTEPIGYYHNDNPDQNFSESRVFDKNNTKVIIGIVLIVFGSLIALDQFYLFTHLIDDVFNITWKYFIPIVLIGSGAYIVMQEKKNNENNNPKTKEKTDFTK